MASGASQAARWQAYQTRARMGAQLWFEIMMLTLLSWAALTMYVIWQRTGMFFPQLNHAFFWRWVICGILTWTPLINTMASRCSVPADGHWYPLGPLTDWMNSDKMYYQPFPVWFWHYGIRTALVPLGLAVVVFMWRSRGLVDAEHLRGLRLLTPRDHHRQLNGSWLTRPLRARPGARVTSLFDGGGQGVRLGSCVIPAAKECEHFLITGSPGAGKSTLIRHLLGQVAERGKSAIVIDPDCEFVQEFYDEGRGDVVLNPLDARCPFWSPWLEFREGSFTMDAEAMAASLIRGQARTPTEEFFRESSRTLIEGIFQVVKDREDARVITDFLALSRGEIQQGLTGTRAYPLVDPGAHEQGSGILATAANAVKPFYHLPRQAQTTRMWSARTWAETREGWIFLSSTEDSRAAIQRLQGVWLDSLVRWLMSAQIGSDQVWIMADELPALEYQPQIERLVTRGRKRGIAVVLGFQNVNQLRTIYGRDGAVTLTSSPTTKVILRVDEFETAQWASDLLGSREVERLRMTQLVGLSSYREGVNLQPERTIEHLVLPGEIQMLEPFTGYLCVAGHDRTTLRIPERYLTTNHPAFIRRTGNIATVTPAQKPARCPAGWPQ
jgi:energy-coupling factor transporter ATP-binding protein EcfA2